MGEIIGLDYNAIKMVMDLYEVPNQRTCFEKVMIIFNYVFSKTRPKDKKGGGSPKDIEAYAKQYGLKPPKVK